MADDTKKDEGEDRSDRFTWKQGDIQILKRGEGKTLAELEAEEDDAAK